ncbi:helix-turn-helix domain-containing protein [Stackebrandtia nassauensis]|uniref:HTH cro/C1-type domain-containing protein n=1 Tax=Stackebrandtia nassauensis (strain DSM 44728 / CIP 108903 / NRRL B-16338 / NBRC 102104 / LLR-40K-21) TaxID=446470 RepID=D3Q364_STANL|nr:helix-turn-helix transcriptional regulator [Stackebrandtia nassauensis]ADD40034.1 hypothetical protein Snas_0316 [Stackebrandtia nassauensis DSM 44728]
MIQEEPIHDLLQRLRVRAGLSERELADVLCTIARQSTITANRVRRWECGDRIPGPQWRAALSTAFDIPQSQLTQAAKLTRLMRSLDRLET